MAPRAGAAAQPATKRQSAAVLAWTAAHRALRSLPLRRRGPPGCECRAGPAQDMGEVENAQAAQRTFRHGFAGCGGCSAGARSPWIAPGAPRRAHDSALQTFPRLPRLRPLPASARRSARPSAGSASTSSKDCTTPRGIRHVSALCAIFRFHAAADGVCDEGVQGVAVQHALLVGEEALVHEQFGAGLERP